MFVSVGDEVVTLGVERGVGGDQVDAVVGELFASPRGCRRGRGFGCRTSVFPFTVNVVDFGCHVLFFDPTGVRK